MPATHQLHPRLVPGVDYDASRSALPHRPALPQEREEIESLRAQLLHVTAERDELQRDVGAADVHAAAAPTGPRRVILGGQPESVTPFGAGAFSPFTP